MIFLPQNKTIVLYTEEQKNFTEATLSEMTGFYGTHYFGRLWNVDRDSLLGLRIYPQGSKPVQMEITVLKKFIHGTSQPTLRGEGEQSKATILFSKDAIRFENMWLIKQESNIELTNSLLKILQN